MGKCVVKKCYSNSKKHNKSSGITFHGVPKDAERLEQWIKVIRLLRRETDWLPTKYTLICSKHFRDKDKIGPKKDSGRVYLSKEAIPILGDESNSEPDDENMIVSETMDINVETDDEIDEITESSRQNEMRKTIERLRSVCANRLKKIKRISEKQRRLINRNKKLIAIIKALKKKSMLSEEDVFKKTLKKRI